MRLSIFMITVAVALFNVADANAQYDYGSSFGGGDTGCGPDFNVNYSNGGQGGGFSSFGGGAAGGSESYSVGITWKMDGACKKRQAAKNKRERAQAEQAAIKTLNEKIAVCSKFDPMNAPQSIRNFCGDLVGVQLRTGTPAAAPSSRYNPYPQ